MSIPTDGTPMPTTICAFAVGAEARAREVNNAAAQSKNLDPRIRASYTVAAAPDRCVGNCGVPSSLVSAIRLKERSVK
jgi:hypothetical protein